MSTIYRVPILPDGTPGLLENWANYVGTGTHDGMAVDECGYLYVASDGEGGSGSKDSAEQTLGAHHRRRAPRRNPAAALMVTGSRRPGPAPPASAQVPDSSETG